MTERQGENGPAEREREGERERASEKENERIREREADKLAGQCESDHASAWD